MDAKLSHLQVKIAKHLTSIEANFTVLKGKREERQVESSNLTEGLIARADDLEQQLFDQGSKVKSLENSLDL